MVYRQIVAQQLHAVTNLSPDKTTHLAELTVHQQTQNHRLLFHPIC